MNDKILHSRCGDSAGFRTNEVFENIRALFRTAEQRQPIEVNELTIGVLKALRGELESHRIITIEELSPSLPLIAGHKGQLHEVVLNLVQNAIDAMDGVSAAPRILRLSTEHHNREVAIAVEDSGPGIDPQKMSRIFDSFFTTKSDGMGLGLAISRMIVEHHFGQIQVSSNPGRGAKFRITLPLTHDAHP